MGVWALILAASVHAQGDSTIQVAPHFKARLPEPSFLKLEEHGAGKPWTLGDASIWQHTRLWLHPDVPNLFGFAFNEAPITSRHVGVQVTLNFTHTDYMLPDSFAAVWLVSPETMDMAVSAQQALFKRTDRQRVDQFPLWKSDSGSQPKLTGLVVIAHRSPETPHLNVKVVDLATATADPEKLAAAFSADGPKLQFNPAKTPQLHLALLHAKGDKFPRVQAWARPAGDGVEGSWTELLSADSRAGDKAGEVTLPIPLRIGFSSFAGKSEKGKTACGVQVIALTVHSFEKSQGQDDKAYLSGLQGQASEASIQEALKGISEDFKAEYGRHAEVMAQTREQLQRLEKQVAQMETKVDGFSLDKPANAPTGDSANHGLLHAFKEAKALVLEETDKIKSELDAKAKVEVKQDSSKQIEMVVANLDQAVERNRSSSTWSLLFLLVVAVGGCATVYSKMRSYEKRHHL